MFASKKKKSVAWPWRVRGLYLILGVSLILNAVAFSTLIYLNSDGGTKHLYRTAVSHLCGRDYANAMATETDPTTRVLLSERVCRRDAATGADLTNGKVVDGHYVLQ